MCNDPQLAKVPAPLFSHLFCAVNDTLDEGMLYVCMCACVHVCMCLRVYMYEETNAMCLQTKYENVHVSFSVTNQYLPIYAHTILIILLTQQF